MRVKPKGKQISIQEKRMNMNEFEIIEKLAEKMNVSLEEAGEALKATGGDLIDAIIYLEKKAKAEEMPAAEAEEAAETMTYATGTEQEAANTTDNDETMKAEEGTANQDKGEETMKEETRSTNKNNTGAAIKGFFRKVKDVLLNNALSVTRNGEEKVRIPAWLLAILLVCCFKFSAIVLIVSLFFGCRYTFVGKSNLARANEFMDKAGDMADKVKAQFN